MVFQDVNDNPPVVSVAQNSLTVLEDFVEYQASQGLAPTLDFGITATDGDVSSQQIYL